MSHRPVCVKCQCEMKPDRIGIQVVDMIPGSIPNDSLPVPYEIWNADVYKCPKCGVEVVSAFGVSPWWNRGQEKEGDDTLFKVWNRNNYVQCHYKH